MEELRESECMWEGGRGRMEGRKRSKEQGGMRKKEGIRMDEEGKRIEKGMGWGRMEEGMKRDEEVLKKIGRMEGRREEAKQNQ